MPTKRDILQIPISGGSAHIPSGAIQFHGGWPGLFLRGDHALSIAMCIRQLEKNRDNSQGDTWAWQRLIDLATLIEQEVNQQLPAAAE